MTTWKTEIDALTAWMRATGTAESTIKIRRYYLGRLAMQYPRRDPWTLSTVELAAFIGNRRWGPEARKSARASARRLYSYGVIAERIATDPTTALPSIRVPAGIPKPAPADVIVRALLNADARGKRMVMLALLAGLRRGEVAPVHTRDVVDGELVVCGKGGKVRAIPLHPRLAQEFAAAPDGHLFPGRIDGHLSPDYAGKILSELLGPGWTAHSLRHAAATRWYAIERDLRATQELLGHAKPETTMRYTKVPDGAKLAAVLGRPGLSAPPMDVDGLLRLAG